MRRHFGILWRNKAILSVGVAPGRCSQGCYGGVGPSYDHRGKMPLPQEKWMIYEFSWS